MKKPFNRCEHTSFKMEGDFCADPFWCRDCGENLDLEDFPFSRELHEELDSWSSAYGQWMDMERETLKKMVLN
ncbi:hypothetical protein [Mesobacillus zeae]|uniref:hypothetical protein n=1 Tax=Mesobacillus zeae TaxID=1917180 RepID=UPI001FECE87C|nr:hypothetical protein [Mesobacillus zeae]